MNFGIIGLGSIAAKFAKGINKTRGAYLYACASRSIEKSEAFAMRFRADKAYGSYEELINDRNVDAVYIALPHPFHCEWSVKAMEQGKHVLCEKPCGISADEVRKMVGTARENKVYFAEGFMYRHHPQTFKLYDVITDKVLGDIKHIKASFGFPFLYSDPVPERIIRKDLGGGGIFDVGCYPLSYVRMILNMIEGGLTEPVFFQGVGVVNEDDIDMHTDAVMKFENGITATISTSIDSTQPNMCVIYGTKGYLSIKEPYTCGINKNTPVMTAHLLDGNMKRYYINADYLYTYEIESLIKYCDVGECPYITHQDSINNAEWIDLWQKQIRE